MEITKLKQVEVLANKYFKCIVRPLPDIHVKGARGVKLIVGTKQNPAYDASVDPNDPNLSIELKENKELLKTVTNPEAPDIRILWILPGTTEQELVDQKLLSIQKSLQEKKPIVRSDPSLTKLETESDSDLAAKLASGEKVDSRFSEWDDEYETQEETMGETAKFNEVEEPTKESADENQTQDRSASEEILGAMNTLGDSIKTLSNDIGIINKRVKRLEKKKKKQKTPTQKKQTEDEKSE